MEDQQRKTPVWVTKTLRVKLDEQLQILKAESMFPGPHAWARASRERDLAITKIQEAIMWLGMDLKAMREEGEEGCENPYPESYNPDSPAIGPTADGLKL